jgi:phosphoribosylaminoimidazole-succinocarboxamide synthase
MSDTPAVRETGAPHHSEQPELEVRATAGLQGVYDGVSDAEVPAGASLYRGKVRDVLGAGDRVMLVASDRISAFDQVLSTVPWKGEILSRISAWWFANTADLVPNHLLSRDELGGLDPLAATGRAVAGRRCDMAPVELVVRGYLTGSAWRDYQAGRPISGIKLPSGLRYCEAFPAPLITPSTKEASGHDLPMSPAELVSSGRVDADLWVEMEKAALALFRRGQELSAARGLILVDTKYEFGLSNGKLLVADEIHTPDSSRYWYAADYPGRFASGLQQRELDKETFRRWLVERGFSGDGAAPGISDEVRVQTAVRYAQAYEAICGEIFQPIHQDAQAARIALTYMAREVLLGIGHPDSSGNRDPSARRTSIV